PARSTAIRGRGLPRRDRVRAPEPAHGGALARPLVLPGAAVRGRAAGRAAGDPAAPERLRRAAEGHGPDRRDRRHRGGAAGPELLQQVLQLHRLRGRGRLLPLPDDPARPLHRPLDRGPRAARARTGAVTYARLRRARVGEAMFPPRTPFFMVWCVGAPPGSPTPPPRAHGPKDGP